MIEEYLVKLALAINNEDMELTKQYVEKINQLYDNDFPDYPTEMITQGLHVYGNSYSFDNECFDYVLENMKDLLQADKVRLIRKKIQLLKNNNFNETKQFLLQQIQQPSYKVTNGELTSVLTQLAISLQDRNDINYFLQLIYSTFFNKEEENNHG